MSKQYLKQKFQLTRFTSVDKSGRKHYHPVRAARYEGRIKMGVGFRSEGLCALRHFDNARSDGGRERGLLKSGPSLSACNVSNAWRGEKNANTYFCRWQQF